MKTIRHLALFALLAIVAASCTSSPVAPDCEDPAACPYQPGTNGYQPGSNG